jgi:parvulin-like peptidyl-prolyl isomerase
MTKFSHARSQGAKGNEALTKFQNEGVTALVFSFLNSSSRSALVALLPVLLLTGCFSKESVVLEKPVLIINGTEVSTKQYSERLALRLRTYDALTAKDESNLERAKEETVKAFILENIARSYAEKNGIKVSDSEVNEEAKKIQSSYPDEFSFRRALADEHIAYEDWKSDLALTVLQKKILTNITSKLPEPTEAEMKDYYEANKPKFQQAARVRLRQIVLETEDDAKRILDQLGDKGDLAKLAKQFSIAPEGSNGGDTGWLDKGTLEVFDQAFKMNVGARSKILKSPYGYHIYEVLKKEPEGRLNFPEAKDKIRAILKERREQAAFSTWLEEQVRKASVKRDDKLLQAIKVTTRGS